MSYARCLALNKNYKPYKEARKKYSEEEKQSEPVRYGADVRAFREFKIIDQYSMLKALMRMVSNIEYQVGISAVRRNYGKKKNEMLLMKDTVIIIGKQNRILCPLKGIFNDENFLKKQKLTNDTKSIISLQKWIN